MIKIRNLLIFFSLFVWFYFLPSQSFATGASLYFSPSSGSYAVGDNFSVAVYVKSVDQTINAVSGTISFSSEKLNVISLSKSNSILTLWVQEPTLSNGAGTINFEGVVLNPGFSGAAGKIITINFKVKSSGVTSLLFSAGSVLANDGKGTNVLDDLDTASFSLGVIGPTASESETLSEILEAPAAPQISSVTHPDPNKWYGATKAKFNWSVPSGIDGVRLLIGRIPQAVPTITYIPPITSKEIEDLSDGVWYFHARLHNKDGWGAIAHFRLQIDTEKPEYFNIKEIKRLDLTDPRPKFNFDAHDKTSGIDYYEIKVDDKDWGVWRDDGSHIYQLPVIEPGKHTLIAKAADKAGNVSVNSAEFIIEALKTPVITEYPKELGSGEILVLKGEAYPATQVTIWLQKEKEEAISQTVESNQEGRFIFVSSKRLEDGIYNTWVKVMDNRGAQSEATEKLTFLVQKPLILKVGSWTISFLAVVIPLGAVLVILIFLVWYGWHKFSFLKKKVKKEVRESEEVLHKAFDLLREDLWEQIILLEKTKSERKLTEEEEKIFKQLKKDLNDTENLIRKEIKDIERDN